MVSAPGPPYDRDVLPSPASTITGWLAVESVCVRASIRTREEVTVAIRRLPGCSTSVVGVYRDRYGSSANDVPPKSLDELAAHLRHHGFRLRRRGLRLVHGWLAGTRAAVSADDPTDAGAELHIHGDRGELGAIASLCAAVVAELGPCAVVLDDGSFRVDDGMTPAEVRRALEAQLDAPSTFGDVDDAQPQPPRRPPGR